MISEQEQYLATVLMQQKIITQEQVNYCWQLMQQAAQQGSSMHFSSILVNQGYVSPQQIAPILQQLSSAHKKPEYLAHYRLDAELGRGGMGAVYKAYDSKLNRIVALKVILAKENVTEQQVARFMQEAKSMAQLRHPNIVEVYEVGESPQNFFTMEYIDGVSFSNWIQETTDKLKPKQVAQIVQKCADALAKIHEKGIVHRDIKSGNIMLDKELRPRLMDFGLAKVVDNELSRTGEIMGTPAYMSPEQTQSTNVDARSDIYSLGATLYEAITSRPPFQGANFVNIACQIVEKDPISPRVLNPDVPVDLEAICLKCLEKKSDNRYQKAQILARDLDNFIHNRPVMAKAATKWTHFRKWVIRNKAISTVISAAICIIAIFVVFLYIERSRAIAAKEIAEKAKGIAEKAEKQAKEDRDRAKTAKKKAEKAEKQARTAEKKAIYAVRCSNLAMAYNFSQKKNTRKVEGIFDKFKNTWETRFIKSLVHDEVASFSNHTSYVWECVFSPDGKFIFSVGEKYYILQEATTGKVVYKKKGTMNGSIHGCAISPDGMIIAIIDWDIVTLLDFKTGKPLKQFIYQKQPFFPTRCVFSPDSKKLLCSYKHGAGAVLKFTNLIIWEIKTGNKIKTFDSARGAIFDCDISANGKWFISAGQDGRLVLRSFKTGKILKVFHTYEKSLVVSRFSPDNKSIVSVRGKYLDLWDIRGKKIRRFTGHTNNIRSCDFSNDGKILVSVADDYSLIAWEVQTGKILRTLIGHTKYERPVNVNYTVAISSCDISPDNNTIVSGSFDSSIKLWKLDKKENPFFIPGQKTEILNLAFSPDGKVLAVCRFRSPVLELWDSFTGRNIGRIIANTPMFSSTRQSKFSSDGSRLLVGTVHWAAIYDVKTKKRLLFFPKEKGPSYNMFSCDYSPDNSKVVVGGYQRFFAMWDASLPEKLPQRAITREPMVIFEGHVGDSGIRNCKFSPDGTKVISVGQDGGLLVWDATPSAKQVTRKPLQDYWFTKEKMHVGLLKRDLKVEQLFGLEDGRFLSNNKVICGGKNRKITVVDLESKQQWLIFKGHTGTVSRCLPTNDGRIIAADTDRTMRIWNINAPRVVEKGIPTVNKSLLTMEDFTSDITALAISKDNQVLAAGGKNGIIKIWHIQK